jgi:microcystin-dependent protein
LVDQYLGEIKLAGYNFAPIQWATCSGQILSIQQNAALFSLLGTTYGGNGTSNFALPNLQSRTICGMGNNNVIGEETGEETVTILISQYPAHVHAFNVYNTFGLAGQPTNAHYLAATRANPPPPPPPPAPPPPPPAAGPSLYGPATAMTPLIPAVLTGYPGGGQPHDNLQPYLGMNYCIALAGVFPSRN